MKRGVRETERGERQRDRKRERGDYLYSTLYNTKPIVSVNSMMPDRKREREIHTYRQRQKAEFLSCSFLSKAAPV